MATDRLENIKAKYPRLHPQADTGWLVAEVERLRLVNTVLRNDIEELQATRIADFEHLADYCRNLAAALYDMHPDDPPTESMRRVAALVYKKLDALKGEMSV